MLGPASNYSRDGGLRLLENLVVRTDGSLHRGSSRPIHDHTELIHAPPLGCDGEGSAPQSTAEAADSWQTIETGQFPPWAGRSGRQVEAGCF